MLLLGKPRSGKTTLAKELCKRHDLVHVCVESWLEKFETKRKNPPEPEEPPEDAPEDWKPPSIWTELEERVLKRLLRGKGPTHLHNVWMLKDQMSSAEAKTKGFVLDLTFYKINVDEEETEEEEPQPEEEEPKPEGEGDGEGGEENEGGELDILKSM